MSSWSAELDDEEFLLLNELLAERFGLHFPFHKRDILASRLRPRLAERHLRSFFDYYLAARYDRNGELQRLAQAVTNHETYFFRETRHFEALLNQGSELLGERGGRPLRLLSAGCSSGEEAYTLGMHARSNWPRSVGSPDFRIDGFDLDPVTVDRARKAEYGEHSLRALSPSQIRTFFRTDPATRRFQLRSPYRQGIRFFTGNIVDLDTFPSLGPYDAIFCRNVFIYFTEAAILASLSNFARVLRPGGLLFLGHAESAIGLSPDFESVRMDRCLAYRRVGP